MPFLMLVFNLANVFLPLFALFFKKTFEQQERTEKKNERTNEEKNIVCYARVC